jgi:hypothetical protein
VIALWSQSEEGRVLGNQSRYDTGGCGPYRRTSYGIADGRMIGIHVERADETVQTGYFHHDHLGSVAVIRAGATGYCFMVCFWMFNVGKLFQKYWQVTALSAGGLGAISACRRSCSSQWQILSTAGYRFS